MKQLLLSLTFLFTFFSAFGQCPTSEVVLTSQEEVDQFIIDFPDCSQLDNLTIEGSTISNLSPLSNLTAVFDNLIIQNNPELTSLEGLGNLGFVFSFSIDNNENLGSLSGLESYSEGMDLVVKNNLNLTDITLSSFTTIHFLTIENNQSLINFNGLSSLVNVFVGVSITENTSLNDIQGLNAIELDSGISDLVITGNTLLETCNSNFVCELVLGLPDNQASIIIEDNGVGCSSIVEVSIECNPCPIGSVVLTTQAEVNEFLTLYPDCDRLDGLTIEGGDVTDLSPLSNLTAIDGNLTIQNNVELSSLEGLNNIISVMDPSGNFGRLEVEDNPVLSSLSGLSSLTVAGGFEITNNDALPSLEGLNNLERVILSFGITNNDLLSVIDNLDSLSEVAALGISNNSNMTSIVGLTNVIYSEASINGNPSLISLQGLEGGTVINGILNIADNDLITDLQGLENITRVNLDVFIDNNINLVSLEGFQPTYIFSLNLNGNSSLQSLTGLENLTCVPEDDDMWISVNNSPLLTDISALSNLEPDCVAFIEFTNNTSLSTCENDLICRYISNGGNSTISNNASGCNSIEEIEVACGFDGIIDGFVRVNDNDQECTVDNTPVPNIFIDIISTDETFRVLTDKQGYYSKNVTPGEYTIEVVDFSIPNGYQVNPESFEVVVNANEESNTDFCLIPEDPFQDIRIWVSPLIDAAPGFETIYEISYENIGTITTSGQITFTFSTEFQEFIFATEDIVSNEDGTLTWNYNDLQPLENRSIQVELLNAQPPTLESDDILSIEASIDPITDDINPDDNIVLVKQTVVNSFDPNDKNVSQGQEIQEDEVGRFLDYRVRFQNTGTANARFVRIEDELSPNLDWKTLRVIGASHDYSVEIENESKVIFFFDDIQLPPEEQDAEGSNGYVLFSVKTNTDLVLNDVIENTASIFFDFNPPIITNTTQTEIVKTLSVNDQSLDNQIGIYPIPVEDFVNLILPVNQRLEEVIVYSLLGEKLMVSNTQRVDVNRLSSGIYFIKVITDQGQSIKKIIKK